MKHILQNIFKNKIVNSKECCISALTETYDSWEDVKSAYSFGENIGPWFWMGSEFLHGSDLDCNDLLGISITEKDYLEFIASK